MARWSSPIVATLALASAGCSGLIGAGELTFEPADAGVEAGTEAAAPDPRSEPASCGGFEDATADCASCMADACCQEGADCRADASCAADADCRGACDPGDAACGSACDASPRIGEYVQIATRESCRVAHCATACGSSCGGRVIYSTAPTASDCASCVAKSCCAETSACAASLECRESVECLRTLISPDGELACTNSLHPSATDTYTKALTCAESHCAASCAIGANFSCLGHVSWPTPVADFISVSFAIIDPVKGYAGVPGLPGEACNGLDVDCLQPIATGTSVDNGLLTLSVPTTPNGFAGYLKIGDTGGEYLPILYFAYPPFTQQDVIRLVPTTTVSAAMSLAKLGATTLDPELGFVGVAVRDCFQRFAPHATVSLSNTGPSTRILYQRGAGPDPAATETDDTGSAVVINVPEGPLTVTGTVTTPGGSVVVGTAPLFVKRGRLSIVYVVPGP